MKRALFVLSFVIFAAVSLAQDGKPPAADDFDKQLKALGGTKAGGKGDDVMERIWCGDIADAKTKEVCWNAYQARMSYYIKGLDHRSEDFAWQHFSGRVIFAMVIGLVLAGMYFAWVQFRSDLKKGAASESEVELGSTVKLKSPVLGVIILGLSLAFFYLYLYFVYPIVDTF
jgi:hypothetical protein